ncbi:uncharacterized protein L201_004699 [Kwoniella dendrophila CBS 6074]|uniref:Uncharacterized protein n=1 Tax=Kwoniella dendrophila CBS 6074 TaxID=1295534 RepID=A0AAX4JZ40_9TREE
MPPRPSTSIRALVSSSRFASTSAIPAAASSSSSTSSIPPHITTKSSSTPPPKDPNRIYTARKTFLWNYYTHLISKSDLILVFDHSNLTSSEWSKIRRSISSIPLPSKSFDPNSVLEEEEGKPKIELIEPASLNVVRTGVLSSLLSSSKNNLLVESLNGQRALLTCSNLSPTYLNKILNSINKSIKSLKRENTKDEKQPSLKLISALLEGKKLLNNEKDILEFSKKTPELDVLRSQLIGLLESSSRQTIGILSQAAGGQLVRTLQGLEQNLKGDSVEVAAEGEAKSA